jgi:hypothetical protein
MIKTDYPKTLFLPVFGAWALIALATPVTAQPCCNSGKPIDADMFRTLSENDTAGVRTVSPLDAWIKADAYAANAQYSDALFWYERSAAKGNASAALEIGLLYDSGWGVAKDHAMAARWYRIAQSGGNTVAMRRLATLYYAGWGVEKNPSRTLQLAREALDAGESYAAYGFAELHPEKARYWVGRAEKLMSEAAPICSNKEVRAIMAGLITDMYHSPEMTATLAVFTFPWDGTARPPARAPDHSIEATTVTNVHGPSECECDVTFSPEGGDWPFKINLVSQNGKTDYLVTRASRNQKIMLMSVRIGVARAGKRFVPGLHDLGPL